MLLTAWKKLRRVFRLTEERYSLLGIALFSFVFLVPFNPSRLQFQGRNLLLALSFLLGAKIGAKFRSFPLALALAYFFSHGVLTWTGLFYRPGWAKYAAADNFGFSLAIVLGVALLADRERSRLLNCVAALCLISSGVILVRKILGLPTYFTMNNSAADACLIASLYPVVLGRLLSGYHATRAARGLIGCFTLLPIAAVAVSGSSTGFVAMAVSVMLYGALHLKRVPGTGRKVGYMLAAGLSLVLAGTGLYFFSPDIPFNDSGRIKVWRDSYAFLSRTMEEGALQTYQEHVDPRALFYLEKNSGAVFGAGSGSFPHLANGVQLSNGQFKGSIFPFMHNDWLEIVFNEGWVGFTLALLAYLHALFRSFNRRYLFTALFVYGLTMLVQFPLRYPGVAFLGALLATEAFSLEGKVLQSVYTSVYSKGKMLLPSFRRKGSL